MEHTWCIMPVATTWYYRPTNSSRYPDNLYPPRKERTAFLASNRTSNSLSSSRISLGKSPAEMKDFLNYMCRPTFSSRLRHESPGLGFTYRNRFQTWDGHFVWSKMDYLQDCYNCMYTRHGAIKKSTKL